MYSIGCANPVTHPQWSLSHTASGAYRVVPYPRLLSPYQYARQAMGVPHTVAVRQNVAVGAAHPSHSGNFCLLVHLLAEHDGPNECATAKSTWCTPQRQGMVHGSSPCMGPIPVSRSDASQGPPHPSVNSARCRDGDCRLGSQCRFKVQDFG